MTEPQGQLLLPGQRVELTRYTGRALLPLGATGSVAAHHPDTGQLSVGWDHPHHAVRGLLTLSPDADAVRTLTDWDPALPPVARLLIRENFVDAVHVDGSVTRFGSAADARSAAGAPWLPLFTPQQAAKADHLTAWWGSWDEDSSGVVEHYPDFHELRELLEQGRTRDATRWLAHWEREVMGHRVSPIARWWGRAVHRARVTGYQREYDTMPSAFKDGDLTLAWHSLSSLTNGGLIDQYLGFSTRMGQTTRLARRAFQILDTVVPDPNEPPDGCA